MHFSFFLSFLFVHKTTLLLICTGTFTFAKLQVDKILKIIPKERKTYLYSATMTKKVTSVCRI